VKKNIVGIEEADAADQSVVSNVLANNALTRIALHLHDPGETQIGLGRIVFIECVDYGTSVRVMKRHPSRWVDTTESCDNG